MGIETAMLPLQEPEKTMHGQRADISSDSMSSQDESGQSGVASIESDSNPIGTQLHHVLRLSGAVAWHFSISKGITAVDASLESEELIGELLSRNLQKTSCPHEN
jgi:hypothetical protein